MSYVRWSSPGHPWDYDSDLYIFDDIRGGTTCCGCILIDSQTGTMLDHWNGDRDGNPAHPETVTHVREHIAAGHSVPDFVIERLADPGNGGVN
jgi:hypothetical protein